MEGTGKKKGAKNSDWTWKEQVERRGQNSDWTWKEQVRKWGPRTATGHYCRLAQFVSKI